MREALPASNDSPAKEKSSAANKRAATKKHRAGSDAAANSRAMDDTATAPVSTISNANETMNESVSAPVPQTQNTAGDSTSGTEAFAGTVLSTEAQNTAADAGTGSKASTDTVLTAEAQNQRADSDAAEAPADTAQAADAQNLEADSAADAEAPASTAQAADTQNLEADSKAASEAPADTAQAADAQNLEADSDVTAEAPADTAQAADAQNLEADSKAASEAPEDKAQTAEAQNLEADSKAAAETSTESAQAAEAQNLKADSDVTAEAPADTAQAASDLSGISYDPDSVLPFMPLPAFSGKPQSQGRRRKKTAAPVSTGQPVINAPVQAQALTQPEYLPAAETGEDSDSTDADCANTIAGEMSAPEEEYPATFPGSGQQPREQQKSGRSRNARKNARRRARNQRLASEAAAAANGQNPIVNEQKAFLPDRQETMASEQTAGMTAQTSTAPAMNRPAYNNNVHANQAPIVNNTAYNGSTQANQVFSQAPAASSTASGSAQANQASGQAPAASNAASGSSIPVNQAHEQTLFQNRQQAVPGKAVNSAGALPGPSLKDAALALPANLPDHMKKTQNNPQGKKEKPVPADTHSAAGSHQTASDYVSETPAAAPASQTEKGNAQSHDGQGRSSGRLHNNHRQSKRRGSSTADHLRGSKAPFEDSTSSKRRIFTTKERYTIYNRSEGHCGICGRFIPLEEYTIDHIIPLSKGGTNDLSNLQACCSFCNKAKDDSIGDDFFERIERIFLYQAKLRYSKKKIKKLKKVLKDLDD